MATRRRCAPPVEIVLTEEELADIIRRCGGGGSAAFPAEVGAAAPAPSAPPPDRPWARGDACPGAVGDAIRVILEATTLGRGRRMRDPAAGRPGGPTPA